MRCRISARWRPRYPPMACGSSRARTGAARPCNRSLNSSRDGSRSRTKALKSLRFCQASSRTSRCVDLCAGGGGKTLALAAMMNNHGQLYATDSDARRLAPIHERVTRAGVRNVQIRTPRARADAVSDLDGKIDCVVVDAPCTGIGTWRRNPDAKWRLRPGSLDVRRNEQAVVLDRAGALVKSGGRIVYITCSILPEENDGAISAFLDRNAGFTPVGVPEVLARAEMDKLAPLIRTAAHGLQMTPLKTGTDGFYVAVLRKN